MRPQKRQGNTGLLATFFVVLTCSFEVNTNLNLAPAPHGSTIQKNTVPA